MNITQGKPRSISATVATVSLLFLAASGSSFAEPVGLMAGETVETSYNYSPKARVGRHVYAGIGMGLSRLEPDASQSSQFTVNDRVEGAGQITIGLDITKHFSAELHSADLGSAGFSPTGRINYHIHGGSVLFYAGKNRHNYKRRGLSGYGRLGLGYLEGSAVGDVPFVTDNSTHLLIGAGIEYMTSIGLGLRLEGISYDQDVRYGQLGMMYRFGRKASNPPAQIVYTNPVIEPLVQPAPRIGAAHKKPLYDCDAISEVLDQVTFQTDSAVLTNDAQTSLHSVALKLNYCGSVPVKVAAHTDSVGSAQYNQTLSMRRANSVKDYLGNQGVEIDRLTSEAFGETKPIDTNATREGRSRNRRVELIVVK